MPLENEPTLTVLFKLGVLETWQAVVVKVRTLEEAQSASLIDQNIE